MASALHREDALRVSGCVNEDAHNSRESECQQKSQRRCFCVEEWKEKKAAS